MFDTKTVSLEWGGKTLTLETGRIARQADGAVLATYGETVVLCAVTAAKKVKEGQDFFPLTVHYQEKFSAAGRIPGGFFKRERGATEKETLTSRLIDRPVRPLFPEGFYNEINVIAQVLSYDGETEPDIVAMIAASAALTISGVPFMGPIGAAREEADAVLARSREHAVSAESELAERRAQALDELERRRLQLSAGVEELQAFEREYRTRLRAHLEGQLRQLDGSGSDDDGVGVPAAARSAAVGRPAGGAVRIGSPSTAGAAPSLRAVPPADGSADPGPAAPTAEH
jgi:hypothetical protein